MHAKSVFFRLLLEQSEVRQAVVIDEKHVLTIIASLRQVVLTIRYYNSGSSWHVRILYTENPIGQPEIGDCPSPAVPVLPSPACHQSANPAQSESCGGCHRC